MPRNDPDGVHDTRDVAQYRQKDVEPEGPAETDGEKDTDGREEDREKNANEIAHLWIPVIARAGQRVNGCLRHRVPDGHAFDRVVQLCSGNRDITPNDPPTSL
jgi:hypothetical protein